MREKPSKQTELSVIAGVPVHMIMKMNAAGTRGGRQKKTPDTEQNVFSILQKNPSHAPRPWM